MTLSVVIPVYNGADFIHKSYLSIINQHIQDLEIIYVDNNSNDNSTELIKNLMLKDSRISLYIEVKQGAGAARNLGIEMAKGDYIYLFDVDDVIYSNALKDLMNVLENHSQVDAVFGKMEKSSHDITNMSHSSDDTFAIIFKDKPYWGLRWFSNLKYVVGPPAFLYRASVFKR